MENPKLQEYWEKTKCRKEDIFMDSSVISPELRFSIIQGKLDDLVTKMREATDTIDDMDKCALVCEEYADNAYETIAENQPWFEDGVLASVGDVASGELLKLGTNALVKLGAVGVTKGLNKGVGKFLLARFKAYTKIYPEIDPITEFESVKYDLVEATEKYHIKFKLAMKWGEKINTRVEVRVYKKKGKDAFAIAYGKQSSDSMYNTEFVWINNKYKKHADFYTASAHAHVGLGHPSIDRLLKKIREEWKMLKDKQKTMVEQRMEESWGDGTFEEKKENVAMAYMSGAISYEAASRYLKDMELAGIHPTDDWYL